MNEQNGHTAIKLNLGSGAFPLPGYENRDHKFGNVIYPLEHADSSIEEVRASHVLEHFPHAEVGDVIKEWVRVLKPGGKLKIAVPDFDWIIKAYANGHRDDYRLEHYLFGGQQDSEDFHKALFNEDKLRKLLEGAGLVDVQKWPADADDCSSYHVSLNLEGRKPRLCPHGQAIGRNESVAFAGGWAHCRCCSNGFGTFTFKEDLCSPCAKPAQTNEAPKLHHIGTPTCEFLRGAKGVIHIGANSGQFRDIYAGMNLPVVWIEAIPEVFAQLQKNIAGYPNQIAFNYLLTDVDGAEYDFHISNNDGQSSSIFEFQEHTEIWPQIKYNDTLKLRSRTLKSVIERLSGFDISRYDAMVLDVQGSELLVLKGLGDLLDNFKYIRCEACSFPLYAGGCEVKDLDEFFTQRGWERTITWRYPGAAHPKISQIYEALYQKKIAPVAQPKQIQHPPLPSIYIEDDKSGSKGLYRIAVATTVPRLSFTAHAQVLERAFADPKIPILRTRGAYWEQGIQNAINSLIKLGADYVITVDGDSIFSNADVRELLKLIVRYPEADAIAAWQPSRCRKDTALAGVLKNGTMSGTVSVDEMKRTDLTPVDNTVYGLTIIKTSAILKLEKPWFLNVPNADGDWLEGKHDSDSYFWHKFRDAGNKIFMANRVRIGHLHEGILWVDEEFNFPKQELEDWYISGRPF